MHQAKTRLLCLLLVVLSSGCWAARQPQPDPPMADGFPDEDLPLFAPAGAGMFWTSTNYDADGQPIGKEVEEMLDFTSTTRTYRVIDDEAGVASQITTFRAEVHPDRIQGITEESNRSIVLLHTPLKPGTTWTYPRGDGAGMARRTIVAIEDICTTYGFFPKALKVSGTTLGPRPGGEENLRTRTEEWFVRGVGRVQVIAWVDGKPGLVLRSVLESFHSPLLDEPFAPPSCEPTR
jgi:hypothetical protein